VTRARVGVFLDRDGTLNEESNYVRTPDELHVIEGAGAALARLNNRGLITCVISNQSGVARGFLTEEGLTPIHIKLEQELARGGGKIDRIYYCPHHPTDGLPPYNVPCDCRKPKIGMLERAVAEVGVDLSQSFLVGDSVVDMQAGNAANAKTILVLTGYGASAREHCTSNGIHIDHIAPTVVEAVDFILNNLDEEEKLK